MKDFLQNNFQNLAKYVDLSDVFVQNAMSLIIAKKLRENSFITNFNLSVRIAIAYIDFSLSEIKG